MFHFGLLLLFFQVFLVIMIFFKKIQTNVLFLVLFFILKN